MYIYINKLFFYAPLKYHIALTRQPGQLPFVSAVYKSTSGSGLVGPAGLGLGACGWRAGAGWGWRLRR